MKKTKEKDFEISRNIKFCSGPARKVPGFSLDKLREDSLGISPRNKYGVARVSKLRELLCEVLQIPQTHKVIFLNGSGTGAMEFLLWNLLGERPVDVFSSGIFGDLWLYDIQQELPIKNINIFKAKLGSSPDFTKYNNEHDCVFVWNETSTGVIVPNVEWIKDNRKGLTICDAVSAVFCCDLPWGKIDATAFSFQKGIGGEAGIGVVVLNEKAIERLQNYIPKWPIPRLFRLHRVSENEVLEFDQIFFEGLISKYSINTISLLSIEDMIFALEWAKNIGGIKKLVEIVNENFEIVKKWIEKTYWANFLVTEDLYCSKHSVCITVSDERTKNQEDKWLFLRKLENYLIDRREAIDILNHAKSLPCLRIWIGPTVEKESIINLLKNLENAFEATMIS